MAQMSAKSTKVTLSSLDSSKLAKVLDCPVCHSLPLPPIVLCVEGHSICHRCSLTLSSCPICQKEMTSARNLVVESLLASLDRKCGFAGCDETVPGSKFEEHVANCDFRPVECNMLQKKTCLGVKMNLKTYLKHLQKIHEVSGVKGMDITVTQFVTTAQATLECDMPSGMWPVQSLEGCNQTFLTGTAVKEGKIFWWIYVIGNKGTANKFMTKISLTSTNKGYEQSWTGPVHSFRMSPDQIYDDGHCLLATRQTLRPFSYNKSDKPGTPPEENTSVGWNLQFSVINVDKKPEENLPKLPKKIVSSQPKLVPKLPNSNVFSVKGLKANLAELDLLSTKKSQPSNISKVPKLPKNNVALQNILAAPVPNFNALPSPQFLWDLNNQLKGSWGNLSADNSSAVGSVASAPSGTGKKRGKKKKAKSTTSE